jgi:hypothetical protein
VEIHDRRHVGVPQNEDGHAARRSLSPRLPPSRPSFATGPLWSHARLESRQVEHVAQDDKTHPRAGVAKLAGQVLDEPGECECRIVLVGWTSAPRQMEIADEDKDLVARLSYVRVPSGTNCSSLI